MFGFLEAVAVHSLRSRSCMIFLCHFFSAASFAWHWVNYSGEIPLLGCIVFGSIFRVFEFFIELDHFSLVVLRIYVGRTVILSFWSY